MDVLLLGTGPASGWPNPFCGCSACGEGAVGSARRPTAALVDGVLLLDPPAGPVAGGLPSLRAVLVSGEEQARALAPQLASATRQEPLLVAGPPAVLAPCSALPDRSVRLLPLTSGRTARVAGYAVTPRGGEATGPVAYDVRAPDGARLLYAPHPPGGTPAPTARDALDRRGPPYGLVLLGPATPGSPTGVTDRLALLGVGGVLSPATDVVAVALPHGDAAAQETGRSPGRGARGAPDGTRLTVPGPARGPGTALAARPAGHGLPARRVLVLGGARSGKSAEAERRLAGVPSVTYVATGGHGEEDGEWAERVAAHRARRPRSWTTVESPESFDLVALLREAQQPVLIDAVTQWLAAVMDECAAWEGADLGPVRARVAELTEAWRAARVPVVAVSDEVGSGVVPATRSGRLFRDELGRLNQRLATASEEVVLVVAGQVLQLKTPPER